MTQFKRGMVMACVFLSGCANPNSIPAPLPPTPVKTPASSNTTAGSRASYEFGQHSAIVLSSGQSVGALRVTPWPNSVALGIVATGVTPGTYRMHVHEIGRCDRPEFVSAGGRWNGDAGDLGPMTVDSNGRLYVTTLLFGVQLRPSETGSLPVLLHSDGASILLYSEQSGGSKPLACAVVTYP